MSAASWLLDLLYPPRCVFCRRILKKGERDFCTSCRLALPVFDGHWDLRPEISGTAAALRYDGNVRAAILRFKFNGCSFYAGSFAPLLAAAAWTLPLAELDAVTWVPVSRRRKRKRGYDQSMLLARGAAAVLDKPLEGCLEKWRDNPPQSTCASAAGRKTNVLGVYRLRKGADCAGKRYLLIDDIVTTGSTAREAARVLLSAGAPAVYLAALATGRDP